MRGCSPATGVCPVFNVHPAVLQNELMLNYGIQVMSVVHFTHTVSRDISVLCAASSVCLSKVLYCAEGQLEGNSVCRFMINFLILVCVYEVYTIELLMSVIMMTLPAFVPTTF